MKKCTRCCITKPLAEFPRDSRSTGASSARYGFGVGAQCKLCVNERRKPGLRAERDAQAELAAHGLKKCGKCHTVKARGDFHKRTASVDGLAYKCKDCVNGDSVAWREQNPMAHKEWYENNKDHKARYFSKWRADNIEAERKRIATWSIANPHKRNALVTKRLTAKRMAMPPWANQQAIEAFYAEAARLTKETGVRHEVDHIVPLQGRTVRGLHWEGNLQVLPKSQNISKHNRRWPDMP